MSPHRLALAGVLLAIALSFAATTPVDAVTPPRGAVAVTALKYDGTYEGECWAFVKKVVLEATGRQMGFDYRDGFFDAGATEVRLADAQSGDIIQLARDSDTSPNADYPGLHTTIILDVLGEGRFRVVDSNSQWDGMVRVRDDYAPEASASRYPGINFHIYRMTGSPGTPPPSARISPAPTTTAWTAGDRATVNSPGECLNLRSAAGLVSAVIKCLPHATQLTLVSAPSTINGRSWARVTSPAGEGWVATEYLVRVPVAPGSGFGGTEALRPYRSFVPLIAAN